MHKWIRIHHRLKDFFRGDRRADRHYASTQRFGCGEDVWFNRERFELLLHLLCAASIASVACDEEAVPVNLSIEASLLHQVVKGMTAAAEKAGYRLEPFLSLLD